MQKHMITNENFFRATTERLFHNLFFKILHTFQKEILIEIISISLQFGFFVCLFEVVIIDSVLFFRFHWILVLFCCSLRFSFYFCLLLFTSALYSVNFTHFLFYMRGFLCLGFSFKSSRLQQIASRLPHQHLLALPELLNYWISQSPLAVTTFLCFALSGELHYIVIV